MCPTPADAAAGRREKKSNQIYEEDGSKLRRNPGERFRLRRALCAGFAPFLSAVQTSVLPRKMVFVGGPRQVGKTTLALSLIGGRADASHPAYFAWPDFIQ